MKPRANEVDATVLEEHRGGIFALEVIVAGVSRRVLAKRCGRLQLARLRIVPGDRVRVELGAADPTRGRIVRRIDGRSA